ncbi:MAG: hypothetical protein H7832_06160 [Magnetococcus sp. DMHC-6]
MFFFVCSQNKADPVTPSRPLKEELRKTGTLTTKSALPLHDFFLLLKNLATRTKGWFSILLEIKKPIFITRLSNATL